MKVTLTHDGKSVELDLTNEQLTALGLKEEKKTGYERVRRYQHYHLVNDDDYVIEATESITNLSFANHRYSIGNYYSDMKLAGDNARADRLMRQLRRFAAENGGIPSVEDWNESKHDYDVRKFEINYDYNNHKLEVYVMSTTKVFGSIYFTTREACDKAVEMFRDELIWYFTEYEAMLR